jgi:hypothetical protein
LGRASAISCVGAVDRGSGSGRSIGSSSSRHSSSGILSSSVILFCDFAIAPEN